MSGEGFIPNDNRSVIHMLAREYGKCNKGRNRILVGAVSLCIATLTIVFGVAFGKVQAEYLKAVRAAGSTASVCIEDAGLLQYDTVRTLSYVKQAGRCAAVGEADYQGNTACKLQVLDEQAWEHMAKPAYTDIHGHYPEAEQEIMLSVRTLEAMGITAPEEGMEIPLTVSIGLFRTEQERFRLSGWYTGYTENQDTGYISRGKYHTWGFDIRNQSDILISQSEDMDWREVEERLYQDVPGSGDELKITAGNTFAYEAVNRMAGSYGMAALGAVIILCGIFFLIHNVMQISMAGDVRQMGLLNTIGATRRQIRGIYFRQMGSALISGVLTGTFFSAFLLLIVMPGILGRQYLSRYGGADGLQIFRPKILVAAVLLAVLLTVGSAAQVIYRLVTMSCVESIDYINLEDGKKRRKKEGTRVNYEKRSADAGLWYMAWRNLVRQKGRFALTVFSLFLGVEAFLGTVVITEGSDYAHAIDSRPDFLIAGKFSNWGQEEGYGNEYRSRDASKDPMITEGNNFCLLYDNDYDEFSPISQEVKESLLNLDGVDRKGSYVMEGGYMVSTVSRRGIRPLLDNFNEKAREKEGVGYSGDYAMVEGFDADVVQVLHEEELNDLRKYVEANKLPVDMESLENGIGVAILHDHALTPKQERLAKESVGEPLYFTALWSKEEWKLWNQWNPEERETMEKTMGSKQSEVFTLSGYLDNRAEGFPNIRQTWHGAEGSVYYLISETGFEKLPTEKKTLYMELEVEEEKEPAIKAAVQSIIAKENRRRERLDGTDREGESGEAGIFSIGKSDLLLEAENYIQGNRTILGSISTVLLFAGLMNYFNVMITGILARRNELEIMGRVGMTKRQRRKLLAAEGMYYCLSVALLMLTVGSCLLKGLGFYMEKRLSYFVFGYPVGWSVLVVLCLGVICLAVPLYDTVTSRVPA